MPADRADSAESTPTAPAADGPEGSGAAAADKPHHPESNVKETIESILVAFILAFVFRAFVVEAFVIPTGSMAPTLLGAHMRFHCADCGYQWDVNYSTGRSDDINIPPFAEWIQPDPQGRGMVVSNRVPRDLHCPNCGFPVREQDPDDLNNSLRGPPVHYGDRILVLKYLYLFEKPKRWDVVVFKSPAEPRRTNEAQEPQFAQNYIKRLVGNPREVIVILDGDVYVAPGPLPADAHRPDGTVDVEKVDWSTFKIQRKPWVVQDALWRNVYDNDYVPHLPRDPSADKTEDKAPWRQPWTEKQGQAGWDVAKNPRSRAFHFDNLTGAADLYFDHTAVPDTYALTDHLAYDELDEQARNWRRNPVGDLKLGLNYARQAGDGPLDLELTKAGETFTARFTRGQVTVLRSHGGSPPQVVRGPVDVPALRSADPVRLEFCNLDYQIQVRVDGRLVFATTDEEYAPAVAELLRQREQDQPMPAVRIGAGGQRCVIEHVSLARDVYYLNSHSWPQAGRLWADPERPIELGPDEYFVLGDNSFISGDARTWIEPQYPRTLVNLPDENLVVENGRVPARFMLGKAFFVYWPAGYRPWSRATFGIIPNFGEMRFIH